MTPTQAKNTIRQMRTYLPVNEIARRTWLSAETVRRLLAEDVPSRRTVRKIERYFAYTGNGK